MDYRLAISDFCEELGMYNLGFIKCRVFDELKPLFQYRKEEGLENEFEEEDINKRINPFLYMEEGKTIISIAFPYLHDKEFDSSGAFSKYTQGQDYHTVVKSYLNKLCEFIEGLGGKALAFTDNNILPERYIAYLGNLGFIGKNNMLITEKYGSYVFLGEILTDLPIETYEDDSRTVDKIKEYEQCGSCDICLKECPTKSINMGRRNPNICLSYITQKKQIEDKWFNLLKGRLFGCDSCQKKCPYNENIELSNIKEFEPFSFMKAVDIDTMLAMGKGEFKETYALTSAGWRGKNLLQRNALIRAMGYEGRENIDIKKINSPYVKEYYIRLLKKEEL